MRRPILKPVPCPGVSMPYSHKKSSNGPVVKANPWAGKAWYHLSVQKKLARESF